MSDKFSLALSPTAASQLDSSFARVSKAQAVTDSDRDLCTRAILFLRSQPEDGQLAARVAAWLVVGQFHEKEGTNESLDAALGAYDQAIELARLGAGEENGRLGLASACMNRGNTLLKKSSRETLDAAISAYEETIRLVDTVDAPDESALLMKGAAWMNLGLAQQNKGTPESFRAALQAQLGAATLFRSLPLAKHSHFRRSLAAACTNQGAVCLNLSETENNRLNEAIVLAREALDCVAQDEQTDLAAADQALRTRRLFCEATERQARAESGREKQLALIGAATDEAELALSRIVEWEARGVQYFRGFGLWFLSFAAALYAREQPHFLAEYLEEWLGSGRLPLALTDAALSQKIARENIAVARSRVREKLFAKAGSAEAPLWAERLDTLRAAEERWNKAIT